MRDTTPITNAILRVVHAFWLLICLVFCTALISAAITLAIGLSLTLCGIDFRGPWIFAAVVVVVGLYLGAGYMNIVRQMFAPVVVGDGDSANDRIAVEGRRSASPARTGESLPTTTRSTAVKPAAGRPTRRWREGAVSAMLIYVGAWAVVLFIVFAALLISVAFPPAFAVLLLGSFVGLPALGRVLDSAKEGFHRRTAPTLDDVLNVDARAPVAVFRSHRDEDVTINVLFRSGRNGSDVRFEEFVCHYLRNIGPPIAIGMPDEPSPRLGAARAYFRYDEWKDRASEFMDRAALLVFIAGTTQGVVWELKEAIRRRHATKAIVLIPPSRAADGMFLIQLMVSVGIQFNDVEFGEGGCTLALVFDAGARAVRIHSNSALSTAYVDALKAATAYIL